MKLDDEIVEQVVGEAGGQALSDDSDGEQD